MKKQPQVQLQVPARGLEQASFLSPCKILPNSHLPSLSGRFRVPVVAPDVFVFIRDFGCYGSQVAALA